MSQFLLYYQRPEPATWVYLSSFLTIGLYFVFHRFWSIRNLDIVLLMLLGPGLLLVHDGRKQELLVESDARETALVSSKDQRQLPAVEAGAIDGGTGVLVAAKIKQNAEPMDLKVFIEPKEAAQNKQLRGFIWLFVVEGAILLRLLFDPMMVRRPLLEPNLTTGGLVFIGVSMLVFLMANVVTSTPEIQREQGPALGPGYPVLNMLPAIPTTPDNRAMPAPRSSLLGKEGQSQRDAAIAGGIVKRAPDTILTAIPDLQRSESGAGGIDAGETGSLMQSGIGKATSEGRQFLDEARDADLELGGGEQVQNQHRVAYAALARTLAIAAHLAVIIGITLIGYQHFGNFKAGAGCATLYLLLPYTAQMTGRVDHVLPAALLVWAILMYRRPLVAGVCLGLAAGLVYYPAFLLPLWLGFYRQRGIGRFAGGVAAAVAVLTILLSLGGSENFKERLIQMYGLWLPWIENLEGVWGLGWQPIWRLPLLVAFVLLAGSYSFWPRQKNLGSLMSCSAALMVAAQFWHGFGGGLFIAWFLPLLLLTIFRPNLEDRVALKVIGSGTTRRPAQSRLDVNAA